AVKKSHPQPHFELANRTGNRGRRASEPTRSRGKTAALGDLDKGRDALDTIHAYCIYSNNLFQQSGIIVQHEMIHISDRAESASRRPWRPSPHRARVLRTVP